MNEDFVVENKFVGYRLKPQYHKYIDAVMFIGIHPSQYLKSIKDKSIKAAKEYVIYNAINVDLWKEAGVLDVWFEKVYEIQKPHLKYDFQTINIFDDHIEWDVVKVTAKDILDIGKCLENMTNIESLSFNGLGCNFKLKPNQIRTLCIYYTELNKLKNK